MGLKTFHSVLTLLVSVLIFVKGDEEPLIGWKGATFKPSEVFHNYLNKQPATTKGDQNASWIEQISWTPRAFIYHNFISNDVADHLIRKARPKMWRSTVEGQTHKTGVINDVRTSYGTFLRRLSDPVITSFEHKLAQWTHLNLSHQEDVQILRYEKGQKYSKHFDTLIDGSPRVCTVLVYLSDVDEGGETAFPNDSEWAHPERAHSLGPFSECAQGHVAAKPKKGDALLFFTFNPDGSQDAAAMHTGCPVIRGVKWTATIWIHSQPFRPENLEDLSPKPEDDYDPADCKDLVPPCQEWAESGECERNPAYMKGDMGGVGHCRLSCKACTACQPGDRECRNNNRLSQGFLPLAD